MVRKLVFLIEALPREERVSAAKLLALIIVLAFLETLGVASVMPFLSVLSNKSVILTNPTLNSLYVFLESYGLNTQTNFLMFLGFSSFLILITTAAYRIFISYMTNNFVERCRLNISRALLKNYMYQPYEYFLNHNSSDLSKTVISEVDQLIGNLIRPLFNMFAHGVVLSALLILIFLIDFRVSGILVTLFGGIYFTLFWSLKKQLSDLGEKRLFNNKGRFLTTNEAFGGIKDVKVLNCEELYLERFEKAASVFAKTQAIYQTLNQLPNFLVEAIVFGALLLVTIFLISSSEENNPDILSQVLPMIGLFALAAYRMKPAVQNIYLGVASLKYSNSIINNLVEDFKQKAIASENDGSDGKPLKLQKVMRLEGVNFYYKDTPKPSLKNITMEIKAGDVVGVVGKTGSGKTTLIDIILGLLRPSSGVMSIDGRTLKEEDVKRWQKNLGYVQQNIYLADASIYENIAFGIKKENIDIDRVKRCAVSAQLHDFITNQLPEKYGTIVGERGVRLSGGQRQRIGIARALYRDPDLLVFDEATSALDSETEEEVMRALHDLSDKITVIIIAHRLSTLSETDYIIYLSDGEIKHKENYDVLLKNNLLIGS